MDGNCRKKMISEDILNKISEIMRKMTKFALFQLEIDHAFLIFPQRLLQKHSKWTGMYNPQSIKATQDPWDPLDKGKSPFWGVGGGSKWQKWPIFPPSSKIANPH